MEATFAGMTFNMTTPNLERIEAEMRSGENIEHSDIRELIDVYRKAEARIYRQNMELINCYNEIEQLKHERRGIYDLLSQLYFRLPTAKFTIVDWGEEKYEKYKPEFKEKADVQKPDEE